VTIEPTGGEHNFELAEVECDSREQVLKTLDPGPCALPLSDAERAELAARPERWRFSMGDMLFAVTVLCVVLATFASLPVHVFAAIFGCVVCVLLVLNVYALRWRWGRVIFCVVSAAYVLGVLAAVALQFPPR